MLCRHTTCLCLGQESRNRELARRDVGHDEHRTVCMLIYSPLSATEQEWQGHQSSQKLEAVPSGEGVSWGQKAHRQQHTADKAGQQITLQE